MDNSRQLSAILFADIQGYTSLMQKDEGEALGILDKYQLVLEKEVKKQAGKIVKNYGDGSLCLFPTAIGAVRCGMSVQNAMRKDPVVPLRIGLHLGDVLMKRQDYYGDSLNIASRIESMGVAGSIVVSKRIRDEVKNKPEIELTSLGKYEFKNVEEGLEIYAISNPGLVVPLKKEMQGKLKVKKTNPLLKLLSVAAILAVVGFFSSRFFAKGSEELDVDWVQNEAIPKIETLVEGLRFEGGQTGTGPGAWEAFDIAQKIREITPGDSNLAALYPQFSQEIDIDSEPAEAKVYAKPVSSTDSSWKYIGLTPVKKQLMPTGNIYVKLEKEGYGSVEDLIWNTRLLRKTQWRYGLFPESEIPEGMIYVTPTVDSIFLNFIGFGNRFVTEPFFVDQYEVTLGICWIFWTSTSVKWTKSNTKNT